MNTTCRCVLMALLLSLTSTTGCSTTSVLDSWIKSDYAARPLTSILVVGLTKDPGNKFRWENAMARILRQSGINKVETTLSAFPNYQEIIDKGQIIDYVNNNDIEGVLVTRLVDTKQETVYHPPTGGYYSGTYSYYRNFDSYYTNAYNRTYSKGYTTTQTKVLLETNLYHAKTQELIWSMSSETIESSSIPQLIDSVSKKVLETLKKDRLI